MTHFLMFILFFGTRPGKTIEAPLPGVPCPYCEKVGQLNATVQARFIHLFWIPVYRLSSTAYVSCEHCKKAYDAAECTPEMQTALERLKTS
jgi:glutaredoxin